MPVAKSDPRSIVGCSGAFEVMTIAKKLSKESSTLLPRIETISDRHPWKPTP